MRSITAQHVLLALLLLPATAQNSNGVLRNLHGDNQIQNTQSHPSDSSRNLGIWNFFSFVGGGHCPIGPLGKHCRENGDEGGSGSGGSGGSSGSSGGSSGGNSSGGNSSSGSDYDGNNVNGANGGNGGGGNNGGGGGGGNGNGVAGAIANFVNSTTGKVMLSVGAAFAASIAIAAMYMGSKRRRAKDAHALSGILKKRIGLFERMASRGNCATCRPEELKEAVIESETDYRLA